MTTEAVYTLYGSGVGIGVLVGAFVAVVNSWLP